MKYLEKFVVIVFVVAFTGSCDRKDDLFAVGPLAIHLGGTWILEKIVTPTRTLTGAQIGYREKRVDQHEGDDDVERIYRNDTLFAKYIWARNPAPISNKKNKTVLMSYRGGLKRFFKITKQSGKPSILEASDYLPEIGTARDSVKFFYTQVMPL
ncbi:hypothetical protein [Dyadobacter psychrophilus]|uniref:Lipocalin-like domain-containing protein n=1 Tax=Dyadobacter psychrophilus TaxID=651661 RepID=A0A1T5BC40_9BACT|nr:hypothetical protein [Dyadobacter psychrophilus]SKB44874.1 hypothetical protein SAMN05660293_00237 [Dyadobacter psychrophilus]